uniref:Uncharacterized protein n=1 Tax=Arion vulgaris TaxID=1028688 RepID=A0A0B7A7E5_9EUPU
MYIVKIKKQMHYLWENQSSGQVGNRATYSQSACPIESWKNMTQTRGNQHQLCQIEENNVRLY